MLDPFKEMRDMQSEMERMFKRTMKTRDLGKFRQPSIDMIDKKKTIVVIAEIPGVTREDITLDVKPSVITISAEVRKEKKRKRCNSILQ